MTFISLFLIFFSLYLCCLDAIYLAFGYSSTDAWVIAILYLRSLFKQLIIWWSNAGVKTMALTSNMIWVWYVGVIYLNLKIFRSTISWPGRSQYHLWTRRKDDEYIMRYYNRIQFPKAIYKEKQENISRK